ncbi:MAG TPA: ABC transporter permease [Thermoplasmata archaeon]|nr:ABC transporter permease [Thermoplasmata archaeon]
MTGRHRLRSLLTLTYMNGLVPIRRQPLYLVNLLASPLSFLFFISIASNGSLLLYGIAGGMLLTVLSIGTSLQADLSHYRHDMKLQDVVVASPVEAWVYVGGMALSELVYSIPGMAVFAVLWATYASVTVLGSLTLLAVLLLVWAFASALGFTLATYFSDVRETFAFAPLISLVLTVLPPVYYPISRIPEWLRPFAYLSPTTYAADLLHGVIGLGGPSSIGAALVDWGVLVGFTAGLLLLASVKARWREP